MPQLSLFDDLEDVSAVSLPPGMVHEPGFLSKDEERSLIAILRDMPLAPARYKSYTARRKVLSFGGHFDYDANRLRASPALPEILAPLREGAAAWAGIEPAALAHVLVAEYAAGTPLGWHRDVPDFETVIGVSLGAEAILRFRPWPPQEAKREDVLRVVVRPRSIYLLSGPSRWAWQHSVAPLAALRWSVTFRTLRQPGLDRRAVSGSPPACPQHGFSRQLFRRGHAPSACMVSMI